MNKKACGIDYSMTSPGITVFIDGVITSYFFTTSKKQVGEFFTSGNYNLVGIQYPEWNSPEERFNRVSKIVSELIPKDSSVVIEGYSFGSTSSNLFQIAENCGALKQRLFEREIHFTVVPPSAIKKYATGKGTAKKEQMYEAFIAETGVDLQHAFSKKEGSKIGSPVSDIVDSYFMCKLASE